MGLICSGDEFCKCTEQALTGLIGILKLLDDILVFADTVLELEERIEQLFKRCLEHQITLADDKIQAGSEVLFGGYVGTAMEKNQTLQKLKLFQTFLSLKTSQT